jgi:hypothetical protein
LSDADSPQVYRLTGNQSSQSIPATYIHYNPFPTASNQFPTR